MNSPALNTYTGEGGTCLQGLPRFLTFHTSTFLPLAKGPKATLQLGRSNQLQQGDPKSQARWPWLCFASEHLLQFFWNKNGLEVLLVKGKPIFALDFAKGRGSSQRVPAVPGRGQEKVTFPLKAQLMFYVFQKSHNLNLIPPPFKKRTPKLVFKMSHAASGLSGSRRAGRFILGSNKIDAE